MSSKGRMAAEAERIDALVLEFAASPDPAVRRNAQELTRLLMRFYGAGLGRILEILEAREGRGGPMTTALLDDDLVASLLVLHDLHPDDAESRIARALDRLQNVTRVGIAFLGVRDGAARVRVDARAGGGRLTDLEGLIEGVVHAAAPDIVCVDIEGLPSAAPEPLVQLARRSSNG